MTPGSTAPRPVRVDVMGVGVDPLTIAAAVTCIVERAGSPNAGAAYVVKPYVEMLDLAARVPGFRDLLNDAWLCLADGVALQWAATLRRHPPAGPWALLGSLLRMVRHPASVAGVIPERVAGLTLTEPLLVECARRGLAVHLVGTPKRQSLEAVAEHMRERFAGLRVTGTTAGAETARAEVLSALQRGRPDVVLVGMGFPRQERLMAWLTPRLDHGVLLGEGGSFDYAELGGSIRRAPPQVRRAGLEWLWRLALEPRRLRRQLAIPRFIWRTWVWTRGGRA